jgi:hypothetical protein
MAKFTTGNIGRPRGARNRVRREVRQLLAKLEREGEVDFRKIFSRLYTIATTGEPGPAERCARTLLNYRFGLPSAEVDVTVEHGVGPSVVELLESIAKSDRHRQAIEERERRLLAAGAITVEVDPTG